MMRLSFKALTQDTEARVLFSGLEGTFFIPCGHELTFSVNEGGAIDTRIGRFADETAAQHLIAAEEDMPLASVVPAVPTVPAVPVIKATEEAAESEELLHRLVKLRRRLSQEHNLPPYIIFHDNSLREMVETLPQTLNDFGRISGVGQTKLKNYGSIFIEEIGRFLREIKAVA